MVPQKKIRDAARSAASTSSQITPGQNTAINLKRGIRQAENSPFKNEKVKRSALRNLTNKPNNLHLEEDKKQMLGKTDISISKKCVVNQLKQKNENAFSAPTGLTGRIKILTRCASSALQSTQHLKVHPPAQVAATKAAVRTVQTVQPPKGQRQPVTTTVKTKSVLDAPKPATRRISNKSEKSMVALENIKLSDNSGLPGSFHSKQRSLIRNVQRQTSIAKEAEAKIDKSVISEQHEVPEGVIDFDKETLNDPFQMGEYAMAIFSYLKERETEFIIEDYIGKQIYVSKCLRSLLIDWMVKMQENLKLSHETLYLAVKLVDIYLGKKFLMKDKLRLLGAAALFIAYKFDERSPPLIQKFLYACCGTRNHTGILQMEMHLLKVIDYKLGIPLSYQFLRRYAICINVPMATLTLARYVLELSLMDYATIGFRDSQVACAALFIALRMMGLENPWSKALEYYTGYRLEEFTSIVTLLNTGLHRKPNKLTPTIRNKYSHKIFYEVAKIPALCVEELFKNTGLLNIMTDQNKTSFRKVF